MPTHSSPFIVPFVRNGAFVDRDEELGRLHQLLMGEAGDRRAPVGVTGMGGLGKTQLAVEYAYVFRGSYPDGVVWVNAAQPFGQSLADLGKELFELELGSSAARDREEERRHLVQLRRILAERFGLEELRVLCFDLGVDYEELPGTKTSMAMELVTYLHRRGRVPDLVEALRQSRRDIAWDEALESPAPHRRQPAPDVLIRTAVAFLRRRADALWILDNVTEPPQLNSAVFGSLVPAALPCRLLFTTRQRVLPRGFRRFDLKVLPSAAAMELLLRGRPFVLRGGHREQDAARRICANLGYLPLALELAAAFLGEYVGEVTLEGYLERLRTEGRLLTVDDTDLRPEDLPTRPAAPVTARLAVTAALRSQWSRLEDDQEAQLVFRTAGQFPEAEAIPQAWLGLLTGIPAEVRPGHPAPLTRVLMRLHAVSLIEELANARVRLHPLVRAFAAQLVPDNEEAAFRRALEENAVIALQDPAYRFTRTLAAGECLLDLGWQAPAMRMAVLDALRERMRDGGILEERRREAGRLLTRLRWLDDARDVSVEELLDYLELIGRFIYSPAECEYLEHHISLMLGSELADLQRAQLHVTRAVLRGSLGAFDRAEEDYDEASRLIGDRGKLREYQKAWARVNLGMGNISRLKAEALTEPEDRARREELLQAATGFHLEAADTADAYEEDVALATGIYIELAYTYALLERWIEAERASDKALDVLARIKDPEAYVIYYAAVLDVKSDMRREKGHSLASRGKRTDALSEFEAAYKIAQQEIAILGGFVGESEDLIIAHVHAGEYVVAMQDGSQTIKAACAHWETALDMARRLEFVDLEQEAAGRLALYCQGGVDQGEV